MFLQSWLLWLRSKSHTLSEGYHIEQSHVVSENVGLVQTHMTQALFILRMFGSCKRNLCFVKWKINTFLILFHFWRSSHFFLFLNFLSDCELTHVKGFFSETCCPQIRRTICTYHEPRCSPAEDIKGRRVPKIADTRQRFQMQLWGPESKGIALRENSFCVYGV